MIRRKNWWIDFIHHIHVIAIINGREVLIHPTTREVLQAHFGAAMLQKNPEEYLQKDFAALAETMALAAGMKLKSENKIVSAGLEG